MRSSDGKLADPRAAYNEIKACLMKFLESTTERQVRIKSEWDSYVKTKNMTAMQFETRWEEITAELEEVGPAMKASML